MRPCIYRKDAYPWAVGANDPFLFRAPNGGAPVVAALGRDAAMRYPSSPASTELAFRTSGGGYASPTCSPVAAGWHSEKAK